MAWIPNVNPNELITSAWGNTIRDHVVNTFATTADRDAAIPSPAEGMVVHITGTGLQVRTSGVWQPPRGTVVRTGSVAMPDLNAGSAGLRDLASFEASTTLPYATQTYAFANLYAGFGTAACNFTADIVALQNGSVTASTGSPVQAIAGAYTSGVMVASWNNPAGMVVGGKSRINFLVGTNLHTGGPLSWQIVAT